MDDTGAVCADVLEWVAYGACGHKDVCSNYVAHLRFICDDSHCCICKTKSDVVIVTKAAMTLKDRDGWCKVCPKYPICAKSNHFTTVAQPYYRMSQPQVYSVAQDQQSQQLLQTQDIPILSQDEDGSDLMQQQLQQSGDELNSI